MLTLITNGDDWQACPDSDGAELVTLPGVYSSHNYKIRVSTWSTVSRRASSCSPKFEIRGRERPEYSTAPPTPLPQVESESNPYPRPPGTDKTKLKLLCQRDSMAWLLWTQPGQQRWHSVGMDTRTHYGLRLTAHGCSNSRLPGTSYFLGSWQHGRIHHRISTVILYHDEQHGVCGRRSG